MASQGKTGPPPNPAMIFDVARAHQLPYILRAGVELGVFTAIAQGSHTAGEIAKACKASERGIRKFLLHHKHLANLEKLTETVRRGGASGEEETFAAEDPIWVDFARGMAPMMVPAAQAMAQMLQPALAGKATPKILDIAAGHGTLGITVARQVPG